MHATAILLERIMPPFSLTSQIYIRSLERFDEDGLTLFDGRLHLLRLIKLTNPRIVPPDRI